MTSIDSGLLAASIDLAANDTESSLSSIMEATNSYYRQLAQGVGPAPFPAVDLVSAKVVDTFRKTCSEREKAVAVVQELHRTVWSTWHVGVASLNEPLTPLDVEQIKLITPALQLLGLGTLITDGLPKPVVDFMQKVLLTKDPASTDVQYAK